ncbi:Zinc finger C2H2 superfamily [Sergentomyia squamirostris]
MVKARNRKTSVGRSNTSVQGKSVQARLMWRASSFLPVKGVKVTTGQMKSMKKPPAMKAIVKEEQKPIIVKQESLCNESIRYVSGQEKPWVCVNCNRNYKWRNSLVCHLKNECGVPPKFFCNYMCGYKTNILSNLRRHVNANFCNQAQKQHKPLN